MHYISSQIVGYSRAGNGQGPHKIILSRYLGADTICIAILMILYVLRFHTVILLRFNVHYMAEKSIVKSAENKLALYFKRTRRTSYEWVKVQV